MYFYVLNPAAGGGKTAQIEPRLRARLKELGIDGEFAKTTGPGDATKMAYGAVQKGYKTIVAVGGDGTVNEVINGVKQNDVAVGVVPIGKLNLVAKRLGVYNWQQSTELLAARRLISYNLMAAGSQYFLSSLAVGFPADWDKQVEDQTSGVKGRLRQLTQSFQHTRDFEELDCQIQIDDDLKLNAPIFYLTITNQKFSNPSAANKLIVSFSDRPTRRQISGLVWQLLTSRPVSDETYTTRLLADRVLIDTKPAASIMIDGKLTGRTPVAVRLTDKRIRFICSRELAGNTTARSN